MNLYKREIYKKSLQHAERRNHKYLYKIGDRYIYPEDVKNRTSGVLNNAKSKINESINKKKAKLRSIGRGEQYVDPNFNNMVNLNRGSLYDNKEQEANRRKDYADETRRESEKWERGEYFDHQPGSKVGENQRKAAKQKALRAEARYKLAKADRQRAWDDADNYEHANIIERASGKALIKSEAKRNKKNDEKWKEEHADKLAARKKREEAEDERYANSIRNKRALRDQEAERRERGSAGLASSSNLEKAKQQTAIRKAEKKRAESERQRKSAHAGYEEDRRLFPEGGSTEELERQKEKTAARKTKARTDATIEEMRKRKKRMDASVKSAKPTRNIPGVKPGGKAPVKETPTPQKKRPSVDRDDLRTYKKAAGMMLDEGRQNEINRRKERSERTKAGNAKMAKEINSENAKKVGKAILYNSKLGRLVKAGESIDDNRKRKKRKASR